MTNGELVAFIRDNGVTCPGCGKADFTDIRKFNLMFKTHQGVTEDSSTEVYLRPETAQGIFVNFPAIQRTTRKKLPFGAVSYTHLAVYKRPSSPSPWPRRPGVRWPAPQSPSRTAAGGPGYPG